MNAEIYALMRLAADRSHRSDPGHHCHTISALLSVEPEHDNHARRRLAILAVETAGLARAMSSHDRGGPMPKRIQRQRTKGWKKPDGAVYVGRGSVFGNPVVCTPHGCETKPCGCCPEYRCCVKVFREYVTSGIEGRGSITGSFNIGLDALCGYPRRAELVRRLPELRGKDLMCWCALDKPCHADVLLELANAEPAEARRPNADGNRYDHPREVLR
jgi:hypothetical protein